MSLQWKIESPIGSLYLVASERGLQGVYWKKQAGVTVPQELKAQDPTAQNLQLAEKQLAEYFAGKRKKFEIPFDVQGTDFQSQVWKELSRIPYGKTISYSDLAKKIGKDKAVRAVGTANGKNPLCIVVPCHRVIAADGGLGGFSGGLERKSKLLQLEQTS